MALNAATGKTYHLAPLLAAAAPGVLRRALDAPAPRAAVTAGLIAVLIGYGGLLVAGIEPPFTLWQGQPGGVCVEVATFAALGLAIGAGTGPTWLARRIWHRPP